jgi:hypothetical protein
LGINRGVSDEEWAWVEEHAAEVGMETVGDIREPSGLTTSLPTSSNGAGSEVGTGPKPKGKYPWSKWSDGKYHIAVRGEDFEVTPGALQIVISNTARRKGFFARTNLFVEEGVEKVGLQFFKTKDEAVNDEHWAI